MERENEKESSDRMSVQKNKVTPLAVLGVSFLLTTGMSISGTLPLIKEQLDLTQTQSELIGTVPSLAVFIFVLLSDSISTKIGMKQTVLLGLLFVTIGGTTPLWLPQTFTSILIGRLILGMGFGLYNSLSVGYINALYQGKMRAKLLGFRNSFEAVGQMALTFLAGYLLLFGWEYAYAIYFFALIIGAFFYFNVPQVEKVTHESSVKTRLTPLIIGTIVVAAMNVMVSIAIAVRYPTLAIDLKGAGYNTSQYLAIMPILGIAAGFCFEWLQRTLSHRILYLAVIVNVMSCLLIGLSSHSFVLLVVGLLISSIPVAWVLPYIFNHIDTVSVNSNPYMVTSFIFVGCNIGVFLSPVILRGLELVTGVDSLRLPFVILSGIFALMLVALMTYFNQKKKKSA